MFVCLFVFSKSLFSKSLGFIRNILKFRRFQPRYSYKIIYIYIHILFSFIFYFGHTNNYNRVPKCDVIENEICEIMGFVKIF